MKPFEYDCRSVMIPQIKPQEALLLFLCSVNVYTASETKQHGYRWMPTGNHISNGVVPSVVVAFCLIVFLVYFYSLHNHYSLK